MLNDGASPVVSNCTFTNNEGSGIHNLSSSPTDNRLYIHEQSWSPPRGWRGMFNKDSSPTVTSCIFTSGGMANFGGSPIVANCVFTGNAAEAWGLGRLWRKSSWWWDVQWAFVADCHELHTQEQQR